MKNIRSERDFIKKRAVPGYTRRMDVALGDQGVNNYRKRSITCGDQQIQKDEYFNV